MPLEDVLDNLADLKRRVAMIPFTPDRLTATKEALSLTVAAVEHLVQLMAEAGKPPKPAPDDLSAT